MDQNFLNPEILLRAAREREIELRREMRGVGEAEGAPKPQKKLRGLRWAFFSRLYAFVLR